jgi:hypothetical protein
MDESLLEACHNFVASHNLSAFVLIDQKPALIEALSDKSIDSGRIVLVVLNPSTVPLQPG